MSDVARIPTFFARAIPSSFSFLNFGILGNIIRLSKGIPTENVTGPTDTIRGNRISDKMRNENPMMI